MTDRIPRRAALLLGAATLALLVGCGGGGGAAPPPDPAVSGPAVSGTFIGLADDQETAVAIIAEPAADGQAERVIRAYLCDGIGGLREWFPGKAPGNAATLRSDTSGATLSTQLAANGATGTATLPDGRTLSFTAPKASGTAGFFDATLNGTTVTGTSTTGQNLQVTLGGPDGQQTTATVDGQPLRDARLGPVQGYQADTEPLRVIVLADGRALGASKGKPSEDPGFTWEMLG